MLAPSVLTAVAWRRSQKGVAAGRVRVSAFALRSQHAENEIASDHLMQQPNQSVQFLADSGNCGDLKASRQSGFR
jgi:hypothetical protein